MAERMVDLTLTLTDNMPAHKLFQRPVIVPHYTHEQTREQFVLGVEGDRLSFATTYMGMIDHIGTHVDAFYHVNPEGAPVDQMPLDMFMGKSVCWDLTHIPDLGDIDVADFEEAEEKGGVKVDGHIVLLNTGLHSRHYPDVKSVWSNPGIHNRHYPDVKSVSPPPRPTGSRIAAPSCTASKARPPTSRRITSSPTTGSAATAASPTTSG